ncbi:MAG: putative membrane protein, partial [Glaciecola sp.]
RRLDAVIETSSHQEMVDQIQDLDAAPDDTLKKQKEQQFSVHYSQAPAEDKETLINILGDTDRSGVWTVPKEIRLFTLLGSSTLDFTDARFSSPNVTVKVFSLLGSDKIFVPENVNVLSKAFCILGTSKNKAPSVASTHAPTITLEGVIILSEISIKIKTTMKENFVAFANKMKTLFESNPKV